MPNWMRAMTILLATLLLGLLGGTATAWQAWNQPASGPLGAWGIPVAAVVAFVFLVFNFTAGRDDFGGDSDVFGLWLLLVSIFSGGVVIAIGWIKGNPGTGFLALVASASLGYFSALAGSFFKAMRTPTSTDTITLG